MCDLKTQLCTTAFCLAALFQAHAASAQTADLRTFATCTGRLSALMEHEWLFSDPLADRTERQRDAMLALAEAMTEPGQEATVLNWRIEAKQAQADLLSVASFARNQAAATLAARRSDELIAGCTGLLLG